MRKVLWVWIEERAWGAGPIHVTRPSGGANIICTATGVRNLWGFIQPGIWRESGMARGFWVKVTFVETEIAVWQGFRNKRVR